MSEKRDEGGYAFPGDSFYYGMSLRDWFAGQALSNPAICTGIEPEWQLAEWFGSDFRSPTGVIARQAYAVADAMLKARQS